MSFLVSPGVHVREIDLTNVVPTVATSIGAIASSFEKGHLKMAHLHQSLSIDHTIFE